MSTRGLRFTFPEPPSINRMLDLAAQVDRKMAYYGAQQKWRRVASLLLPPVPPDAPWERWAITRLHFRLWNPRDPLELSAGAKWGVDLLVDEGFVVDDGPSFLVSTVHPTQEVDRARRAMLLEIEPRG